MSYSRHGDGAAVLLPYCVHTPLVLCSHVHQALHQALHMACSTPGKEDSRPERGFAWIPLVLLPRKEFGLAFSLVASSRSRVMVF